MFKKIKDGIEAICYMNLHEIVDAIKYDLRIKKCCYTCKHAGYSWDYEAGDNEWDCGVSGNITSYNQREHACNQFERGKPQEFLEIIKE